LNFLKFVLCRPTQLNLVEFWTWATWQKFDTPTQSNLVKLWLWPT